MNQTGPWSVKGIDQRARDAAREAASAEGLTLGEYLNRLLMSDDYSLPNEISSLYRPQSRNHSEMPPPPQPSTASSTLDRLTRRIEAAEARSTLAITGMDHTVLGLVAKLEQAEGSNQAVVGHVENLIEELRGTHEALQSKVRRLEEDDSAQHNLDALKSLEDALGKLATHVYEESEMTQNDTQAIKGRVESGFADLNDRVEGMETKVQSTLSEAAARVEKAVQDAEKQSKGAAKEVAERLSAVEADVSGALESMEGTLLRIQDRLNRAETTTDAALKSLESTFTSLDSRIEAVAQASDPELADRLRAEFEAKFEDLTKSVRETVDQARLELADEISRAAEGYDGTAVTTLKTDLTDVQKRLAATEERQTRAMETVSSQVNRMSSSFDERIREVEARDDTAATEAMRAQFERLGETVSARIDTLAERVDQRVTESETRSADAIEQIGEQVATVASRLQKRQDDAVKAIATHMEENRKRTDARLSDALSNVSDRLEQIQSQSTSALSPVQRAIASLATRLESLEEFTSPPYADPGGADMLPDAPDFATPPAAAHVPPQAQAAAAFMPGLPDADDEDDEDFFAAADDPLAADMQDAFTDPTDTYAEDDDDDDEFFEAGIQGWDAALETARKADEPGTETSAEDTPLSKAAIGPEAYFDPLSELDGIDGVHDSHTEARASDIFDTDDDEDDDFLEALMTTALPELEHHELLADELAPIAIREDDTSDYIARARRAAISAAGNPATAAHRRDRRSTDTPAYRTQGSASKLPLYAAASAVVITGAAVGGYLYIRGKQAAPAVVASVDTYVDPGAPEIVEAPVSAVEAASEAAALAEAPMEDAMIPEALPAGATDADLFDVEEAAPASAASAPAETKAAPAPAPAAAPAPAPKPVAKVIAATASFPAISPFVSVESAAASGNHIAQYQLAQDRIAAGDYASGASMMRKSATKGLPIAQYGLAKLHEKGMGVPKDLFLARDWTQKAAEGGNVKAMHDLAVYMAEGEGGTQSYAGAVEWFRKAAEFGIVDSQYNLGILYEQGLGISPNLTEALFWFEVAGKSGDPGAPAKVSELKARVSPEAAEQAHNRAVAWEASRDNAISNGRFGAQPWNTGNPLQVQGVQVALSSLGYQIGTPDGVVGGSTSLAIRTYEAANGLPVTGTITGDLIDSLNARAAGSTNG
jgi:localization factor PodJL